jgi:hypothetical protein
MLVMNRIMYRQRDEGGAILVTVVVVMLVGFVIATVIASSVLFTIQSNVGNKRSTQAFIAAESGRDAAFGKLKAFAAGGACVAGTDLTSTAALTGTPAYEYTILTSTVDAQTPPAVSGLSATCPTKDTKWVFVRARGLGPGDLSSDASAGATVEAYYPWTATQSTSPGGTVAYFDGQFKATKSLYEGDLVIRTGNYECNSDSHIQGNLWVLGGSDGTTLGNLALSTGCTITGSVYVAGLIGMKGGQGQGGISIGGDIIANGNITLDSDAITFAGSIHSAHDVVLKKSGVAKNILAVGTIDKGGWTVTPPGVIDENAAAPVYDPPLHGAGSVWEITNWIDLGSAWSDNAQVYDMCSPAYTANKANPTTYLDDYPASRLVLDYTKCTSDVAVTLGTAALANDVAIVVAPNRTMSVTLSGNLTTTGDGELWLVHADSLQNNKVPNCGNTKTQGNKVVNVEDTFAIAQNMAIGVRVLIYSPCGIGGNQRSDFTGQLYTNNDNRTVQANFNCRPMSWPPYLPNLSCTIRGEGGAAPTTTYSLTIGDLDYQTEQ